MERSGLLSLYRNNECNVTGVVGARMEDFASGTIYWSAVTSAHEVHGAILAKFRAARYAAYYGLPITDESQTPDGIGRYNHFTSGRSIYWTPSTGAHPIYGSIRAKWASLGWERSRLGYPVCPESCGGLAGESPVRVVAKQPCSWWPAEGETRLSKRHDKVALGGEQVIGPYERNPVAASLTKPREIGDKCGSRARGIWAKAMDGAKTLEVRHLWTRRRIGSGTITQSTVEQERSVSTPAMQAQRRPSLGAPVTAKPISVDPRSGGASSGSRRRS
jgi:hypothetical protein